MLSSVLRWSSPAYGRGSQPSCEPPVYQVPLEDNLVSTRKRKFIVTASHHGEKWIARMNVFRSAIKKRLLGVTRGQDNQPAFYGSVQFHELPERRVAAKAG